MERSNIESLQLFYGRLAFFSGLPPDYLHSKQEILLPLLFLLHAVFSPVFTAVEYQYAQ